MTQYYVAANGNNGWSGKIREPKAEGTDGPFAMIERARDEVRRQIVLGLNKDVMVEIRGGEAQP